MSEYRKWDESKSPQWKYLLQKESEKRRKTRKEIEHERREKEKSDSTRPKKHSEYRKQRKKGRNIKKYIRTDSGTMRQINGDSTLTLPREEILKNEYRATQEAVEPQE